jgi:non-heme chloroperoxidase
MFITKDWGAGQPLVSRHGWPLSADAWKHQIPLLAHRGFRSIAHLRSGHGRSSQPWNGNKMGTYGDDLRAFAEALDLKDAIHVSHSTGGSEVVRLGRHGPKRVGKAVLIDAAPPRMLKTPANPGGLPIEVAFSPECAPSLRMKFPIEKGEVP